VPGVLHSTPVLRATTRLFCAVVLSLSALLARVAQASECAKDPPFSVCFDANTLWLPAGRASFLSMPDTRVIEPGQVAFGAAGELLHRPVVLRVASPDREGRDIQVLENAFDVSYFVSAGVVRNLETSMLASLRLHQSGAGVGGIDSQAAPALAGSAVRDPRVGVAYSLDEWLAVPGLGLRVAVDATLPLGDRNPFANERSFVVMPNATFGLRHGPLVIQVELGARLRRSVDFAGTMLSNQGFVALGMSASLFPGWLSLSAEVFGLPPLSDSRGSAADSRVTSVRFFPAEWLASVHSCFGKPGPWTFSVAAGSGVPLSSETRRSSSGQQTSYFTGVTTPDFRSLLVVRFVPETRSPTRR
jgi:OmpA-OmpF porin, OOP family